MNKGVQTNKGLSKAFNDDVLDMYLTNFDNGVGTIAKKFNIPETVVHTIINRYLRKRAYTVHARNIKERQNTIN